MMTMGSGLEADLNHIFEQPIPHSRLRRMSVAEKKHRKVGQHVEQT